MVFRIDSIEFELESLNIFVAQYQMLIGCIMSQDLYHFFAVVGRATPLSDEMIQINFELILGTVVKLFRRKIRVHVIIDVTAVIDVVSLDVIIIVVVVNIDAVVDVVVVNMP